MENKNQHITASTISHTKKNRKVNARLIISTFVFMIIMVIGFFAYNNPQSFQSGLNEGGALVAESFYIPTAEAALASGNVYGDDIASSFIIFKACTDESSTCVPPVGVTVENNQIFTPDTFDPFYVRIYVPEGTGLREVSTVPLEVIPTDCSYLSASLMMATGEGMFTGDPDDLPEPAISETFDFAQVASVGQGATVDIDFDDLYSDSRDLNQLIIENPVSSGSTVGSKLFTLTVDFNDSVTGHDSNVCTGDVGCEAYTAPGDCESTSDTLTCEWDLCDMNISDSCHIVVGDNTPDISLIAQRFADAIEDMYYSAFDATSLGTVVTLTAIEKGTHTNAYTYSAVLDNLSVDDCTTLSDDTECENAGCTWGTTCTGKPCKTFNNNTSCLALDDTVECLWDDPECSSMSEDPFTIGCTDLGGCFAGGEDSEPLSVENIILSNTTSNPEYETGHKLFDFTINFDSGITGKAVKSGNIITVKDEGLNTQATAQNFAYVFNVLLGNDSPFFANTDPLNTSGVILTTKELGLHTNYYTCNVNGLPFGTPVPYCFSGGDTGSVDVLVAPITLDTNITQGEVALIYAGGSIGDNTWKSSDPSIVEVAPFSEIDQITEGSSATFMESSLAGTDTVKTNDGTYTLGTIQVIADPAETIYPVTFSIPVEYQVSSSLSTLVNVDGTDYTIPVEVDGKLYGNLIGSGSWSSLHGLNAELTGTLKGIVQGYASGDLKGMVRGPVSVDVTSNAQLLSGFPITSLGVGTNLPNVDAVSPSSFIEADGDFTSTVTEVEDVITDVAVLYAKRPGTTILSVTDQKHCTAFLNVTTVPLEVILQIQDASFGDVFDAGDDVQINAYIGTAGGDFSTMDEITTSSKIEWFSGNIIVADFTANDGLLSILAPGTTNITARYDTGQVEIGTIESNALQIKSDKITALTIFPNKSTQAKMPTEIKNQAYQNVILAIHNPEAVGSSVVIEGTSINISLPVGDYDNDLEKVEAIASDIKSKIPTTINVTQSTTYPGILQLLPATGNTNGIVDISSTASDAKLSIIPYFGDSITLPSSETYGMMVIAEYESGKTKYIDPGEVKWINNPFYLDDTKLLTGLLKSVVYENSTLKAEYENANSIKAVSSTLTIISESGPVIESIKRIGSTPITKGSQINLEMKVTDVDTIADIQDIRIYLVKSNYSTYNEIDADASAVWFDAITYPDDIIVTEEGDDPETESVPALLFKVYDLPVGIPNNSALFDGHYKLIISITDSEVNTLNYVYPIYIGPVAMGDVTGDGQVTIADVFLAYQIYTGAKSPTSAQLQAANMDGKGGITLVDVMLLWQSVSSL